MGHVRPHIPQLVGAERLPSQPFAGFPSQLPKPALQVSMAQVPAEQMGVAFASAQTRPHAPQFATLPRTSTSQPSAALPLQLPKPVAQDVTEHAPRVQPAVAFVSEHARPHMPQLLGVVARFASHPFAAFPSQSPKPAEQVYAHVPMVHVAELFARAPQGAPHAPQWAVLPLVSVSQPFEASPSQFPKGAMQLPRPQAPLRQTGTAFGSEQRRSQPPQLAVFVWVSAHAPPQQVCPEGHGRVPEQPETQVFPTQRAPGAQCSSRRQSTHAWVPGSQRRVPTPPSPGAPQLMSSRQPITQRFGPVTQRCPVGHRSSEGVQATQRPAAVSHTGPPGLPTQPVSEVQPPDASATKVSPTSGTSSDTSMDTSVPSSRAPSRGAGTSGGEGG